MRLVCRIREDARTLRLAASSSSRDAFFRGAANEQNFPFLSTGLTPRWRGVFSIYCHDKCDVSRRGGTREQAGEKDYEREGEGREAPSNRGVAPPFLTLLDYHENASDRHFRRKKIPRKENFLSGSFVTRLPLHSRIRRRGWLAGEGAKGRGIASMFQQSTLIDPRARERDENLFFQIASVTTSKRLAHRGWLLIPLGRTGVERRRRNDGTG
jgi:hypothetical protein